MVQVEFGGGVRLLETELNEMQKIRAGALAELINNITKSGVFDYSAVIGADITSVVDGQFCTNATANTIGLGKFDAAVSGQCLPAYSTGTGNLAHVLQFAAPPGSGSRYDLGFLEVGLVEVVGPSGNIKTYGGAANANLTNDIVDGRYGSETTRRIQLQWRIRIAGSVNFGTYALGVNDPSVKAWGATSADTAYAFTQQTPDTGLFMAGDGSSGAIAALGTIDGYSWAIPLVKVNRRTSVTAIANTDISDLRNRIMTLDAIKSGFLALAGGTMTGSLILAADPSAALEAATKQYADSKAYTLPKAAANVLGGIKVGSNLSIDANGVLSGAAAYSLPVATGSVLGGVKAGTGITVAGDGTISVGQLSGRQLFTASGTFTVPTGVTQVWVTLAGGGGGGGGVDGGNATAGGASSFGGYVSASGGGPGGSYGTGGSGGASGGSGGSSGWASGSWLPSYFAAGGNSIYGVGGVPYNMVSNIPASDVVGKGFGGGGGGVSGGGGGGADAKIAQLVTGLTPGETVSVTIGAGGVGGGSGYYIGAMGAPGFVLVEW